MSPGLSNGAGVSWGEAVVGAGILAAVIGVGDVDATATVAIFGPIEQQDQMLIVVGFLRGM